MVALDSSREESPDTAGQGAPLQGGAVRRWIVQQKVDCRWSY